MTDLMTLFKSHFWYWKFFLFVIPFENGKFKPDDTKTFSIGMDDMYKAKKDNVLKPNDIPGPGQYRILFHSFLYP